MTTGTNKPIDRILHDLQERAKELNCLYKVDEILARPEASTDDVLRALLEVIPLGWQYPSVCVARIQLPSRVYEPQGFQPTAWLQTTPIVVQGEELGRVEVCYTEPMPAATEGPFLAEERRLLGTIA